MNIPSRSFNLFANSGPKVRATMSTHLRRLAWAVEAGVPADGGLYAAKPFALSGDVTLHPGAAPQPAAFFGLHFHPVGVIPTADLADRDVMVYNQCDGYHIATIHFDDEGNFDGFWPFVGSEFTQDFYRAWALLPDCNDDLFPVFAKDELAAEEPKA
jgi:hypothetical protein